MSFDGCRILETVPASAESWPHIHFASVLKKLLTTASERSRDPATLIVARVCDLVASSTAGDCKAHWESLQMASGLRPQECRHWLAGASSRD